MSAVSAERFDLAGPLPDGLLAIEASAGTGKTFTLAALATRFIAESGIAASELLIVTFTRAATTELRAPVRQELVEAATHLRLDTPPPLDDVLLAHLLDAEPAERHLRLERIEQAVTEFDAMTITTIHGFATQVLGTLGVTAGTDLDATLVDDANDLAAEVCADVLATAAVAGHLIDDLPTYAALLSATKVRINTPDLLVVPAWDQPDTPEKHRVLAELVRRSVDAMDARRRRAGTLSFDDILVELRRALTGLGQSAVINALRDRFRVALIDEFQDTDPVQWTIFSTLFGVTGSGTTLVLVGDPKQAIYAFRGANISTYNDAVAPRPELQRRSLATNWRSDGSMIAALNALFEDVTFGDERIAYVAVDAAPENQTKQLGDHRGGVFPPLSLRLALAPELDRTENKKRPVKTPAARRAIYGDMVERIRELLDHAELPGSDSEDTRPVRPSDIAVLVRTGTEAADAQAALLAQGVPAVLARGGSVLRSPAAEQWRWLLEALIRPSDPARARTFALSWFCGLDPLEIDELDDDRLGTIQETLRSWADTLNTQGVTDFIRCVWTDSDVARRVLQFADGDRQITDLNHLAELLQTAHPDGRASVAGLLAVLDTEPALEADADADRDLAARRVESEQQAVQIMTTWVAKGLEFPIVCCPTLWGEIGGNVIFQDPDTGLRTFDVANGKDWPDPKSAAARKALARHEDLGENLRLVYVALTRAKHHTLLWWSPTRDSPSSALARVLFARTNGVVDPEKWAADKLDIPADEAARDLLTPLVDQANGGIVVTVHGRPPTPPTPWADPAATGQQPGLAITRLDRVLDRARHRWSFTAITSHAVVAHSDPFDSSLSDAGASDEAGPDGDSDTEPVVRTVDGEVVPPQTPVGNYPLALLPAGAQFGTLVHSVLEAVDFHAADLDNELATRIDDELAWQFLDLRPDGTDGATNAQGRELLVAGLRAVIETPLGPLFDNRKLGDIPKADRLNEMTFELLLGEAGHVAGDRDVGHLTLRHLETDDPLHPWATKLASGAFSVDLAGHLTGSIDAVLRTTDAAGRPRFVIVDYKTNRLHTRGHTPRPGDYGRDSMAAAMDEHHYPLQAMLYAVALHRYLRWRLADYNPDTHLGGAAYLFVRGMNGTHVPTNGGHPDGVFSWAIPPRLVTELSDLLDGRRNHEDPS